MHQIVSYALHCSFLNLVIALSTILRMSCIRSSASLQSLLSATLLSPVSSGYNSKLRYCFIGHNSRHNLLCLLFLRMGAVLRQSFCYMINGLLSSYPLAAGPYCFQFSVMFLTGNSVEHLKTSVSSENEFDSSSPIIFSIKTFSRVVL